MTSSRLRVKFCDDTHRCRRWCVDGRFFLTHLVRTHTRGRARIINIASVVQVRLPGFAATYPTLHVDAHLGSVKSTRSSRFGYSQIDPRSRRRRQQPVRIRGRAPEAQAGWCQSRSVFFLVWFVFLPSPVTPAGMRCRDGARL